MVVVLAEVVAEAIAADTVGMNASVVVQVSDSPEAAWIEGPLEAETS